MVQKTVIKSRKVQYRDPASYGLIESIFGEDNHFYIPQGRNILVMMYKPNEKNNSGLYIPDVSNDYAASSTSCGLVLARGPYAYDEERGFSKGESCNIGDWVDFRKVDVDRKVVWVPSKEDANKKDKIFVGTIRDTDVLSIIPSIHKLFSDSKPQFCDNLTWEE
jgi:hypothetical protein